MAKREIIRRDLIEVLQDLPEFCYARNLSDGKPILLKRGSTGYWIAPRPGIDPYAQNERLKITVAQEEAMMVGSLCGFDVPGADPLNYSSDPKMLARLELKRAQDKSDFANEVLLRQTADIYRTMPNGGALQSLSLDGTIGDGITVTARFSDKQAAMMALVRCGFTRVGDDFWKLKREEVAA